MSFRQDASSTNLLRYEDKDDLDFAFTPRKSRDLSLWRKHLIHMLIGIPWILLLVSLCWNWYQHQMRSLNNSPFPQLTYSPVQDLLEYETRKFELGFRDETTEYQGYPSPEIDQRWDDLYMMGISTIPRSEAARLVNRTSIFPHHERREYIIELDVFHQLHCLNMIRKALSPEYYPQVMPGEDGEDELLGFHHINHCVDAIRQSLMCTVDVTPLVWQWSEERQMHVEKATVMHTCRNFDRVREWAAQRSVQHKFDYSYREMNDPLDPSSWENGYSGE